MAKQLWFQSGPATTHRGVNDTKLAGAASWWQPRLLAETRGSGATTVTAASIAGTTVGIEFTNGAVALEWLSEPLSADFTIAGTISANLWGLESTMNDNTAINFVVDKVDGATGAITQIAKSARVAELATAVGVNNFTVAPTSTAVKRGDRLRLRPFIDDAGAAMIVGTSTFSYNGAAAAAAGDSYVQFTENLTFELSPGIAVLSQADQSGFFDFGVNVAHYIGQPFVASGSTLAEVSAWLFDNVATDNLVAEIQTDNVDAPSGTVVGTVATVAGTSIGAFAKFTWATSISLTLSTKYWLVLRRSGALTDTNYYEVATSTGIPAGWSAMKRWGGSSWGATGRVLTVDLRFSGAPDPAASTYYLTDTAETINPGSATEKKALTTRGSGSVTVAVSTVAGPTAGVQV